MTKQILHDGLVVTVFSCSRYCGTNDNKGAFIVFNESQSLSPMYHSYYADAVEEDWQLGFKEVSLACVSVNLYSVET